MELAILVLGLFFNVAIASAVLIKDYKQKTHVLLAAVGAALIWWETANFLADKTSSLTLFWNRATFVGPLFIIFLSDVFITYLKGSRPHKRVISGFLLGTVAFSALSLTNAVVTSTYPSFLNGQVNGYNLHYGWGYSLWVVWILVVIFKFVANVISAFRHATGQLKQQLNVIVYGSIVAISIAVITNLILPNVLNNSSTSVLAPFASVIFMGSLAFAIVKHGLFNIRLVITRSLAYILAVLLLLGGYSLISFLVINTVASQLNGGFKTATNLFFILITAVCYGPIKRFFDRITNRLFYRDAYDPQAFLDQLNSALVANLDLSKLLKDASAVISNNLKSEYCTFGIKETNFRDFRVIGNVTKEFTNQDIAQLRHMMSRTESNVVVTDYLSPDADKLREILAKNDVAVLARITPASKGAHEGLGYIFLGQKKSGNPYSNQDVQILDIIARELLIAIQNALHFEEIQNFNVTLQQKVDDATKKLRHANDRLKALDETKDDFISMASHQLRTPLTSVKGYLSMVLEGDAGKVSKQEREMLGQAFFSSQRMVYLIADLLNVSRLKTGKFVIEPTKVNLATVVEQEIGQLKETAQSRQLTLTYDEPKDFPEVMLDETKTRQVIMNFVDNAIYYTPAGGHITVKLINSPETIELRVEDDGIGVPKSEQPHLFTKFYRAGNARKARPDGTGLGLFMAKKVVAAQGGSVIFESQEGKGSTFGFAFSKSHLRDLHVAPSAPATQSPVAKEKELAAVK